MYCVGSDRSTRHCQVKNLCYDSKTDSLFILKSPSSLLMNVPKPDDDDQWKEFLDETTQREHNLFYLDLGAKNSTFFTDMDESLTIRVYDDDILPSIQSAQLNKDQIRLTIVREPTLFVKRFYPYNVMHILHDDYLGYAEQWKFWGLDRRNDTRFVVYDHNHATPHDQIYDWLGPKMKRVEGIMGWPHWVSQEDVRRREFVCFKDAVIGTSKDQTWYQYGYYIPQGPLPDLIATGTRIREIGAKVLAHLEQPPWDTKQLYALIKDLNNGKKVQEPGDSIIGIFSRKLNRLILNEEELAKGLEAEFGLPVVFLRMEEMSLNTIAKHMRRTAIAFGMHGSLLAMAMFMPPGAILIEGYPYGVPANNYTPYKTMCNLPGMELVYRAWSCSDPKDVIGYPNKSAAKGGIRHLPEEEQKAILESTTIEPHLCCTNPYWLYRIYQDTRINISEVISHIRSAVSESCEIFRP